DFSGADPHYYGHRDRLRQRLIEAGADSLPDYELLEFMLFANDLRKDVKPLAKALIERFGGFAEVLGAEPDALRKAGVRDPAIAGRRDIANAAKPLGVTVHDHLIIGRGRHTSLRDLGLLN